MFRKQNIGKHAKQVGFLGSTFAKVSGALIGTAGLIASLKLGYDAMKEFGNGTKSANDILGKLLISLGGATASGALIGTVIAPRYWYCNRCFSWVSIKFNCSLKGY